MFELVTGTCHNAISGASCNNPASWVGIMSNGVHASICDHCKEHGEDAPLFERWEKQQ